MDAAAVRWRRSVSRWHLPSLCRTLSAASNGKRDQPGGLPSFSDLKNMLSGPKPQEKQAEMEVDVEEEKPKPKTVSSSSLFDDVRASLRKPSQATPKVALEEIRKNLSEFRTKSAPPAAGEGKERLSFESIRDSLRQLRSSVPVKSNGNEMAGSFSLKAFGESLRLQPGHEQGQGPGHSSPKLSDLPPSYAKQTPRPPKTEFTKMYSYDELGAKLRKLRPQGEKPFSLTKLNDRLQKLREIEDKESESNIGGLSFKDLRESLFQLRMSSETSNKKSSLQRLALLGQLGGQPTPSYMISPPKDELVQQDLQVELFAMFDELWCGWSCLQHLPRHIYFHLDNMSSKEKLKLELKKVKEDFKIHAADCGSSHVQVAQLTTKIKYLSQVLRKKDKHSRKGLYEMIQRRKKLLKYLRGTDWDSYCLVISKLGLRDNPDYKT